MSRLGFSIYDPCHALNFVNDRHTRMPGLSQPLFDDGGANGIFIDHEDGQVEPAHAAFMTQRSKVDKLQG
jgi:hypothetical protein